MEGDSRLWTVDDVAAFLGVAKCWVYEQTRRNQGPPFVRIGPRHIRFVPLAVRAWVEAQRPERD